MKKYIPWAIIIVLLMVIFTDSSKEKKITVTIPEEQGQFKTDTVVNTVHDTVTVIKWETKTVTVNAKVNDTLVHSYTQLTDSLQRLHMYLDAITLRNYKKTFNDDYFRLDVTGQVQGKVNTMNIDYTIKERQVDTIIKIPRKKFGVGVFGGLDYRGQPTFGVGVNYNLLSF